MARMLDLDGLKQRVAGLVMVRSQKAGTRYRPEAILPLQHVLATGPLALGDFNRMTGLGERTGRTLIAHLIQDGLLVSDSPKGEGRIGFPLDALNILLPDLHPEAATAVVE